jgi:hypothetical protein
MSNLTCAKCGSDKIIPKAKVDGGGDLGIPYIIYPKRLVLTTHRRSPIHARVCAGCGHIELYTAHTEDMWEAYQESLKRK